jgi:hypothetical protein
MRLKPMLFIIGLALRIEFFQICFFESYYHLRAKIRNISDVRKFKNTFLCFDEKNEQRFKGKK